MVLILIGLAFIAAGIVQKVTEKTIRKIHNHHCINCAYAHKSNGANYPWLNDEFGQVIKIEFEEPVENKNIDSQGNAIFTENNEMIGNWQPYTDEIWDIHCRPDVIDHSPDKLIDQHVKAFINPQTRFARLKFTLQKYGKIYQMEPTERFYELEQEFFIRNAVICDNN